MWDFDKCPCDWWLPGPRAHHSLQGGHWGTYRWVQRQRQAIIWAFFGQWHPILPELPDALWSARGHWSQLWVVISGILAGRLRKRFASIGTGRDLWFEIRRWCLGCRNYWDEWWSEGHQGICSLPKSLLEWFWCPKSRTDLPSSRSLSTCPKCKNW